MKRHLLFLSWWVLCAAPLPAVQAKPDESIVKVLATVRYPNPLQPWTKGTPTEVVGSGVVIEGNRILTTAHLVLYATELYVQSRPGQDKSEAKVEAIGYDLDLAVLSVGDKKFFEKRPALPRAKNVPRIQDAVTVYGFPVGGDDLSVTKGVVSRVGYNMYQVSAAINAGNSGGPAMVDGAMIGMVASRLNDAENIGFVIGNAEIEHFLQESKGGRYEGKATDATASDFQRLENEALRALLKLDRQVKGILVLPPKQRAADYPFKEFDVLTKIGDYDIDNDGVVQLPNNLRVFFADLIPTLAQRNTVRVTVLRNGSALNVRLPVTTKDNRLIREYRGEPPSYFIHGPLVFSPLKANAIALYYRVKPALDNMQGPLLSRRFDRVLFPDEELVVVTAPLFKHKIARGYSDPVGQVVQEVNGQKIKNLRHLVEFLCQNQDEYLKFRFAEEATEILVFRRQEMNKATEEIMEENGIAASRRGSEDMLRVWKQATTPRP